MNSGICKGIYDVLYFSRALLLLLKLRESKVLDYLGVLFEEIYMLGFNTSCIN